MPRCELCFMYEACGLFKIVESHPLETFETKMWLCQFCYEGLRSNDVKVERVSPSYPAQTKHEMATRVDRELLLSV